MRKLDCKTLFLVVLGFALIAFGSACHKKAAPVAAIPAAAPPPAPAPAPPDPAISISASPNVVTRGQSTTLSWSSTNATMVTLDGGIGEVPLSGRKTVTPADSMTYTATAVGPGGNASAEVRVTVTEVAEAPPPPRPVSDEEFFQTRVQDIFFDYDKYDVRGDMQPILESDLHALAERLYIRLRIEGHCDERGSEKYNIALGDRRANAIKAYLVDHGISADRVDTVSYGKERPFDTGHDEEAWARNRRAHFVMMPLP